MKKLMAISMVAMLVAGTHAATYTWDGSDNSTWDTWANWTTAGTTKLGPTTDGGNHNRFNQDATTVTISNGDTVNQNTGDWSFSPGNLAGSTFNISGGSTLNTESTYMAWAGDTSTVNLTGSSTYSASLGTVDLVVGYGGTATFNVTDSTFNTSKRLLVGSQSGGSGTMTVSGSTSVGTASQGLTLSYNEETDSTLTINDGTMNFGWGINFGGNVGTDSATARLYINGGEVKANNLAFNMSDAQVVFSGGELLLHGANITEAEMQTFIDGGDISVVGGVYEIGTVDLGGTNYTSLTIPEPGTIGLLTFAGLGILTIRRRWMK